MCDGLILYDPFEFMWIENCNAAILPVSILFHSSGFLRFLQHSSGFLRKIGSIFYYYVQFLQEFLPSCGFQRIPVSFLWIPVSFLRIPVDSSGFQWIPHIPAGM